MGAVRTILYKLNETAVAGELETLLGQVQEFDDVNLANVSSMALLSGRRIVARWVKNSSGTTLNPGEVCTWLSGSVGTHVGGVTGSGGTGVGAVSPFVTSVPNGAHFWLIQEGPGTARSGAAITANVVLIPTSTGEVITVTNDAAGSLNACGRAITAAGAADVTINVFWKFPGY